MTHFKILSPDNTNLSNSLKIDTKAKLHTHYSINSFANCVKISVCYPNKLIRIIYLTQKHELPCST